METNLKNHPEASYTILVLFFFFFSFQHQGQFVQLMIVIRDWKFVFPSNSYVEALIFSVAVFGDGPFKEVIMVKWNYKGWTMI